MFWKSKKNDVALEAEIESKRLDFDKKQFALNTALHFMGEADAKHTRVIAIARDIEKYLNNK